MQPRSLQQILSELDNTYQPQVDSIRQRQAAIPGQIQAEEQGLGAKQEQAFGDILGGARRRGLGFAGIPLGEQAKYTATEYLPALARLRQSGREQAMSLEDAILGIQERRQNQGQSIYQYETSLAEQQRQFNEQQAAAQRAASANPYAGLLGSQGGNQKAAAPKIDPSMQKAYGDVQNLLTKDAARIQREYEAIKKSAGFGNPYDRIKLQLLNQLYPGAAQSSGKNTVPLTQTAPKTISLQPKPYTGLSVGNASSGSIRVR